MSGLFGSWFAEREGGKACSRCACWRIGWVDVGRLRCSSGRGDGRYPRRRGVASVLSGCNLEFQVRQNRCTEAIRRVRSAFVISFVTREATRSYGVDPNEVWGWLPTRQVRADAYISSGHTCRRTHLVAESLISASVVTEAATTRSLAPTACMPIWSSSTAARSCCTCHPTRKRRSRNGLKATVRRWRGKMAVGSQQVVPYASVHQIGVKY